MPMFSIGFIQQFVSTTVEDKVATDFSQNYAKSTNPKEIKEKVQPVIYEIFLAPESNSALNIMKVSKY